MEREPSAESDEQIRDTDSELWSAESDSSSDESDLTDSRPKQRKKTEWSFQENLRMDIPFKGKQDLLVPRPDGTPIGYFNLFVDDDFLKMIVDETNKYAFQLRGRLGLSFQSRITSWKNVDLDEFKIFLGLLLHMGTIQLNRLQDYWKKSRLFNFSIFPEQMSRNRFLLIMRCLHFHNEDSSSDRLVKIKPIIDYFNSKMKAIYYPGRELCVDESMILRRGKLVGENREPNRRQGLKLNMLSEPNGIVLYFHVEGCDELVGTGHTVINLLEGKLKNGHAIYLDYHYNSYDLARKLLESGTYCTGTLRPETANNPEEVVRRKLGKNENISMFADGIHIGKWKSRKEILYLSTEFGQRFTTVKNRRGQESSKPKALAEYSKHAITADRIMCYYPCSGETMKWYKKIFIHVLQLLLMNAHRFYNKCSGRRNMDFYDFRLSVIDSLLPPQKEKTVFSSNSNHRITKITAKGKGNRIQRKRCRMCSKSGVYKRTRYHCEMCKEKPGLCIECFEEYHKYL